MNLIALPKPSWKHGFSTLAPWNWKIPFAVWPTLLHHKDKSISCLTIISNSCSPTPLFPRFSNFHDLDWFFMNFTSGILQSHFPLLYLIEFPFHSMITPLLTPKFAFFTIFSWRKKTRVVWNFRLSCFCQILPNFLLRLLILSLHIFSIRNWFIIL